MHVGFLVVGSMLFVGQFVLLFKLHFQAPTMLSNSVQYAHIERLALKNQVEIKQNIQLENGENETLSENLDNEISTSLVVDLNNTVVVEEKIIVRTEPLVKEITRLTSISFDQVVLRSINYRFQSSSTKGIIMCMSNNMVPIGASLIEELRELGNYEPIQVYHCQEDELSERAKTQLRNSANGSEIEIIDVCSILMNNGIMSPWNVIQYKNFWLKPIALLFSSFDEVILMDIDNIFFENPSHLRLTSRYRKTGTLFFHDRVLDFNQFLNTEMENGETFIKEFFDRFPYNQFGLNHHEPSEYLSTSQVWNKNTAHEQDSSLVLLHKRRAGPVVLKLLWHLVTQTRFLDTIAYSWGDKEAFWLSYELGGVEYSFSPWDCSVVSRPDDQTLHPNTLCGSLAQYYPEDDATNSSLFYVNGRDVISPRETKDVFQYQINYNDRECNLLSKMPQFVTPRHERNPTVFDRQGLDQTCLIDMGANRVDQNIINVIKVRIKRSVAIAKAVFN
ncbi:hypothetical protein THRCLA_09112 [Thraustotheca clavata]|uniref:Uncharacterized protein n=1 Tax=Thraustotheca clavata TaxID=74557 RepID=A0A1V9YZX4_9STRA|nr:hypothetical protein THRCLA_09112 [Thraustotheca clavata]